MVEEQIDVNNVQILSPHPSDFVCHLLQQEKAYKDMKCSLNLFDGTSRTPYPTVSRSGIVKRQGEVQL